MAFSNETATRALVDCGRRCCLCHKYCGTNMELHHIVPRASGGGDDFDNCIPLCFDDHAEVEHYNAAHPKGRKFSAEELRQHRDRWYARTAAPVQASSPEYLEADRKVFETLSLNGALNDAMEFARDHNFAATYHERLHDPLDTFTRNSLSPYMEFFNVEVEGAKADLRSRITDFSWSLAQHTFLSDGARGLEGWRHTYSEDAIIANRHLEDDIDDMNRLAGSVWDSYGQYVRTARQAGVA